MGVFCMFFFIFFVKRPDGLRAGVILAVQDTGGIFRQILADSAEALLRPVFNVLVKSFASIARIFVTIPLYSSKFPIGYTSVIRFRISRAYSACLSSYSF